MSRATRVSTASRAVFYQPHRHYAPYQWAFRPFATATTAARSRSASAPPQPPQAVKAQPESKSSGSPLSYTGPRARHMDIQSLNRIESANRFDADMTVDKLTQQGEDIDDDLPMAADKSSLVFHDLPLGEVLATKTKYGSAIHSVGDDSSIGAAMDMMKSLRIGAVLVHSTKVSGDIVGIISTRDYVTKVTEGADPRSSGVTDFMTESPVFAYSDDTAIACLELMQKHRFRHLPVRDRTSNRTVGLVSIGDLVRVMLSAYKESNKFLKDYIDGQY